MLIETYKKFPIELTHGAGSFVWDKNGKKYLDFYGGHAVCLLGHSHPNVVEAIHAQASTLLFYSNIFHMATSVLLAEALVGTLLPNPYEVYFTNSGSEANEAALKIARKETGKKHVIAFKHSFHGRGIAALGVTGIDSYHTTEPNLDAFTSFAELGDMQSVIEAWTPDTAAVICEPIQSIGGMNQASPAFYQALEAFCDEKNMLLIFDEVQTGLGRTGSFWFAQSVGVTPDILTTAKGLGGGLPISAVLVKEEISEKIKVGDLATTFGGGPVPCAAGLATLNVVLQPGFIDAVSEKENSIREKLSGQKGVVGIRGKGLLLGIELSVPAHPVIEQCLSNGLIIGSASEPNLIRIMPPLTITPEEIDQFVHILTDVLSNSLLP